jgi:glycosyltransferase involved in cell wall biosynthesis
VLNGRLTVVIPTKDESVHIARCIESARELGPVVVIDSVSNDGTQGIARSLGAQVVERPWSGYAEQKNWALSSAGIETEWVLFLDADEYLTERGRAEIVEAVQRSDANGYLIPRDYVFLRRHLRHAWWYPDYQLRLFRRTRARFEDRLVHEHPIVDEGLIAPLEEPLIHENLKGLTAFIERHNRYSELEARERLQPSAGRRQGSFRGAWLDRRRALKERVWYRLPFRPLARFLWLYVVRRGFLDGRPGFLFCALIASYELMIDAKVAELRKAQA